MATKTKVKTFTMNSQNPQHHERLDNSVNAFIETNNVEVVDIKYSTCVTPSPNGGFFWIPSALLLYRECDSK